jgi:hypothetical protein
MEEVWGSNPHSSTGFPDLGFILQGLTKGLRRCGHFGRGAFVFCTVAEHGVHDIRPAADGGHDHVSVDGLGDVGGLVAHGVADVLQRHAVAAHDRHGGVASLMGMPAMTPGEVAGTRTSPYDANIEL